MPGRGSYGIHDRAQRVMETTQDKYGPERGKSIAYAIATQQAHKLKKTPKKGAGPRGMYGTPEGKSMAKEKHYKPTATYKKTAAEKQALLSVGAGALAGRAGDKGDWRGTILGGLAGPMGGIPAMAAAQSLTGNPLLGLAAYGAGGAAAGYGAGRLSRSIREHAKAKDKRKRGREKQAALSILSGALAGRYASKGSAEGTIAGAIAGPMLGVPVALGVAAATDNPAALITAYGLSAAASGFAAGKLVDALGHPKRGKKKTAGKSIREALKKTAFTMGGQGSDLRAKPPLGMTTNFPTEESKSFSNKQLNQSQQAAEVGPSPSTKRRPPHGEDIAAGPPHRAHQARDGGGGQQGHEDPGAEAGP